MFCGTIVTLALLMMTITNQLVFSAVVVKPYRDSFDVIDSYYMSHSEILGTIYDAEQARIQHGPNLSSIANKMRLKMNSRYTDDFHCFASIDPISGALWAKPHFVYLKSDSGDNMHIVCFKSPWTNQGASAFKIL